MKGNGENNGRENVRRLLDEGAVISALKAGVQRALRVHKALGNPIARDENGKVVLIPPEKIAIDEPAPPRKHRRATRSRR